MMRVLLATCSSGESGIAPGSKPSSAAASAVSKRWREDWIARQVLSLAPGSGSSRTSASSKPRAGPMPVPAASAPA